MESNLSMVEAGWNVRSESGTFLAVGIIAVDMDVDSVLSSRGRSEAVIMEVGVMSQNGSTEPVPFRQSLQESVQVNGSFSFAGRAPGVPLYGFGGRSEWVGTLTLYRIAPQLQPPLIIRG